MQVRSKEMVGSNLELTNIAKERQKKGKHTTSKDIISSLKKKVPRMEIAMVQLVNCIEDSRRKKEDL